MPFPSKTAQGAAFRKLTQDDYKQMYEELRKHYDNLGARHRAVQSELGTAQSVIRAIKIALARCG